MTRNGRGYAIVSRSVIPSGDRRRPSDHRNLDQSVRPGRRPEHRGGNQDQRTTALSQKNLELLQKSPTATLSPIDSRRPHKCYSAPPLGRIDAPQTIVCCHKLRCRPRRSLDVNGHRQAKVCHHRKKIGRQLQVESFPIH